MTCCVPLRKIESDEAQLSTSVATYHDALVTLTADVATAFIAARTAEAQRAVLKRNAAAQRDALRIAEVRCRNGETSTAVRSA